MTFPSLVFTIIFTSFTFWLFEFWQAIHDLSVELVLMALGMLNSGLSLFCYCYYGKYATDNYESFAACIYNSNWMNLPIDLQKSARMMIANAQIPLNYHGYGVVNLNLDTFAKVSLVFFFCFFRPIIICWIIMLIITYLLLLLILFRC